MQQFLGRAGDTNKTEIAKMEWGPSKSKVLKSNQLYSERFVD